MLIMKQIFLVKIIMILFLSFWYSILFILIL